MELSDAIQSNLPNSPNKHLFQATYNAYKSPLHLRDGLEHIKSIVNLMFSTLIRRQS